MSVEYYINKFVNEIENDFEKIPKNVKTNLKELYLNNKSCKNCKKAYDCTYTGNEDTSKRQHIDTKTKEYLRTLKDHFNDTCILKELGSSLCANPYILNSKREEIFEGCMKVLLEIQQQSSISTPYMSYRSPISMPHMSHMSHMSPRPISMTHMSSRPISMSHMSPRPILMPYFSMTPPRPLPPPQTYDPEFLRFLTSENRNSLMSSSNQKGTLKRMLNFNPNNVFNERIKKRRKTNKLKRQSNR